MSALAPLLMLPLPICAEESVGGRIDEAMRPLSDAAAWLVFYGLPLGEVRIPFVLMAVVLAGVLFTVYFRFINVRALPHGFRLLRGDYSDPLAPGEVSHSRALAAALAGTVGLGNIAGVAIAISLGGPGAAFWMMVAGLLGMSLRFAESTLAVRYRNIYTDGTVSGGPMYYLSKGLAARSPRLRGAGRFLAAVFAVFCVGGSFGGGNMLQANQGFRQLLAVTGAEAGWLADKGWMFGALTAMLVALVILGGVRRIAGFASRAVPLMAALYLAAGLAVLALQAERLPDAVTAIVNGAFSAQGIAGGIVGALMQGFRIAAISNEAGIGSGAIAHAAARTQRPVAQGLVALYEPLIDTIVVCGMTALLIVVTGAWDPGADPNAGVALASAAFGTTFPWFPPVFTVAVLLFAFTTMLAWSYYGLKAWTYLFGDSFLMDLLYKLLFLLFIVAGASMQLDSVIRFSTAMVFAMAVPNLLGMLFLLPEVRRELDRYWLDYRAGRLQRYGRAANRS